MSPPRRARVKQEEDMSPPRRQRTKDEDMSPPRRSRVKEEEDMSPPRRSRVKEEPGQLSSKTLDGKKAGLQSARALKDELDGIRQREKEMFSKVRKCHFCVT